MATAATATTTTAPCNGVASAAARLEQYPTVDMSDLDEVSRKLREDALNALEEEPELTMLLHNTVLAPGVRTFEDAVANTITYRLLLKPCHMTPSSVAAQQQQHEAAMMAASSSSDPASSSSAGPAAMFCPNSLRGIIADALHSSTVTEAGHTMAEAVRLDAQAVCERDPAVDSLLEVVLFMKGFAALVCHRAAYYKWQTRKQHSGKSKNKKSITSLWLQSQASAVFGVDIHPAATMGAGIMLDHATGIVIGETATVGDGCTLLHGVTLGGTGKDSGDRHPKVGKYVLIGANASLLGNITIGCGAKIGAGSIVLRNIPAGATAVGAPAKIIGRAKEAKPGSTMDETLQQVSHLSRHHQTTRSRDGSPSEGTASTAQETSSSGSSSSDESSTTGASRSSEEDSASENEYPSRIRKEKQAQKQMQSTTVDDINNESNSKDTPTAESKAAVATVHVHEHHQHQHYHHHHPSKETNTREHLTKEQRKMLEDPCCPYRDYIRMSQKAPKGTVSFCNLKRFLAPEGCDMSDIGEVLFALDTHTKGYIRPEKFFSPHGIQVLVEKTKISAERVEKLMKEWQEQMKRECAMLHQLKVQTEDIKQQSHKHSISTSSLAGLGKQES